MTEYGVFNDEGCIERGFYHEHTVERAAKFYAEQDEHVWTAPLCDEHEEQDVNNCEECNFEELVELTEDMDLY